MEADTERLLRRGRGLLSLPSPRPASCSRWSRSPESLSCEQPVRPTSALIGTWQSDADRTLAAARQLRPVDEKQEALLRKLFGKLRVTYTGTAYTTELDGVTESGRYEVLGRDRLSVVIREVEPKPSPLEVTAFTLIHFDGPDSHWLYTKIGGIREYFKRIK